MSPHNRTEALPEASSRQEPPLERPKAVLFCPTCGHEGHAASDWRTKDDYLAGRRALVCPECATTVTERPLPNRSANAEPEAESAWTDTGERMPWETWRDLCRSSVALLATWPRNARC